MNTPAASPLLGPSPSRFSRYAWFVVAYLVFVILFGAWVRISGSGAGCGDHWPLCNGTVIQHSPAVETIIELSHRLTSGLLGLFAIGLAVVGWRIGGRVRVAALVTLAWVIVESLIGAGIVLKELVASNASSARAIIVALHLANTLILTAAATLTAHWAGGGPSPRWRGRGAERWLMLSALLGVVAVSMTGAVTALGDTLFPVQPTADGALLGRVRADLSPTAHFLVRLRIVHPLVAALVASALLGICHWLAARSGPLTARWCSIVSALVFVEIAAGVANIALNAPGWLQLVHLLLAQALWIALVLLGCAALSEPLRAKSTVTEPHSPTAGARST